jgi:hypothetical protein
MNLDVGVDCARFFRRGTRSRDGNGGFVSKLGSGPKVVAIEKLKADLPVACGIEVGVHDASPRASSLVFPAKEDGLTRFDAMATEQAGAVAADAGCASLFLPRLSGILAPQPDQHGFFRAWAAAQMLARTRSQKKKIQKPIFGRRERRFLRVQKSPSLGGAVGEKFFELGNSSAIPEAGLKLSRAGLDLVGGVAQEVLDAKRTLVKLCSGMLGARFGGAPFEIDSRRGGCRVQLTFHHVAL